MSKFFAFAGLVVLCAFGAGAWKDPAGTAAVGNAFVQAETAGLQAVTGGTITAPAAQKG